MSPQEYVFLPLLVYLVNGAVALYMVRRLRDEASSGDGKAEARSSLKVKRVKQSTGFLEWGEL